MKKLFVLLLITMFLSACTACEKITDEGSQKATNGYNKTEQNQTTDQPKATEDTPTSEPSL